jgi:DNA (cytosine-5)-methyltransferase 1
MKRDHLTMPLDFPGELIIDNFAGGGGTSEGLEQAFGRPVDIAINHDPEALAMHALNHPKTLHLCESVWTVNPVKVTRNQPVGLVWLSPDCKHFSKAKGGTPVAKHIRGLAWVGMRWVALTKPRALMLENVEEFQDWGPLMQDHKGDWMPDPAKKGKTFDSFVAQLRGHGYAVDWREMRACDNGAPTIRKRLFLVARRDGLPITWPEIEHGEASSRAVLAGKLLPFRTAAECIDFHLPANSIFDRKKELAENTQRRVAKGLWRHVLTSPKPFIVGVGGRMGQSPARSVHQPAQTITAKADSCLAMPVLAPFVADQSRPQNAQTSAADAPLRTQCAQVKGGHFTLVGPSLAPFITGAGGPAFSGKPVPADQPFGTLTTENHRAVAAAALAPLRGTSPGHMGGHDLEHPLSTVSAGGTHHALLGANLITIGYGEKPGQPARAQDIRNPLGTVVAANKHALAAVHLTHLTHHGDRPGRTPDEPLPTITGANRGEQAMVAAHLEQANGGFYDGEGRSLHAPMSTVTAAGSNQQLVSAYCVKYYSSGGQWQGLAEPMHTLPTKGRMGLVQTIQVSADCLAPEHQARARACAALLHKYLPEHFPEPADLVLIGDWVLVDITLRMLRPRELFRAQGFPEHYIINEIPDPAILFKNGVQSGDPLLVPRIPLTATAQVRMCGNSVSPYQAKALVLSNFGHERLIYPREAA